MNNDGLAATALPNARIKLKDFPPHYDVSRYHEIPHGLFVDSRQRVKSVRIISSWNQAENPGRNILCSGKIRNPAVSDILCPDIFCYTNLQDTILLNDRNNHRNRNKANYYWYGRQIQWRDSKQMRKQKKHWLGMPSHLKFSHLLKFADVE